MPRLLILFVALIAVSSLAYGQETARPLPAVKRILDKAVGKVRANRTEFDKANEKPLSEARQELQDLSTKLIKDGKTDEATAVLAHVKTLEADVMRQANAPPPLAGGGAEPRRPLLERMAGKWELPTFFMEIRRDGFVRLMDKASGRMVLEGTFTLLKPELAEVTFSDGAKRYLLLAGEDDDAVLLYGVDGKFGMNQRAP